MVRPSSRLRVSRALEQFAPAFAPRSLVFEPLGEGAQAETYSIRARDRRPSPEADPDLVFKLYRAAVPGPGFAAADEFDALARLHATLNGRVIGGWRVRTPEPLFLGDSPAGLIMTRVPGRSINAYLAEAGGPRTQVLASLADAVAVALGSYWRGSGRIYGDIDFNNILIDPESRTLSFVDPGMPGEEYLCEAATRDWFPASRDLAYMLFEVAVSVRLYLGNRVARRCQAGLIEAIVLAFAEGIGLGAERHRLLDEIHACTRIHLARIRAGWTPTGAWRLFLKGHASRSLGRTIRKLKTTATETARPGGSARREDHGEVPCWADRFR
jgi:hypothetical protein